VLNANGFGENVAGPPASAAAELQPGGARRWTLRRRRPILRPRSNTIASRAHNDPQTFVLPPAGFINSTDPASTRRAAAKISALVTPQAAEARRPCNSRHRRFWIAIRC